LNEPIDMIDSSNKEIMSEFKLADEEKGLERHSRNTSTTFYHQMASNSTLNSVHTTMDIHEPSTNT